MKRPYLKPRMKVAYIGACHELLAASGTSANGMLDVNEEYTDAPALSKEHQGLWDE